MNHYKKPAQEKSSEEIIINVGTNDLSSDKEPKNIANDIIWLAKSVKTYANKVAVPSILSSKDKCKSKATEVNTYLHYICSSNKKNIYNGDLPCCHYQCKYNAFY